MTNKTVTEYKDLDQLKYADTLKDARTAIDKAIELYGENAGFFVDYEEAWGSVSVQVQAIVKRPETPDETKRRVEAERKEKERIEAAQRKQYEHLAKKFGKDKSRES